MPHTRSPPALRTAPVQLAAVGVVLAGVIALTGWILGVRVLTSLIPGAAEMKANTALALVLCGVALCLLANDATRPTATGRRVAQALGVAVLALAFATLAEYFFGTNLGLDEVVVRDTAAAYNVFPGRMSPFSAAALAALGAALAARPNAHLQGIAGWAAGGAAFVGSASLLGYLWNASDIITDRLLPPVALNTAGCFLALGIGILLLPRAAGHGTQTGFRSLAAIELKVLGGFVVALSFLLIGGAYTYRATVKFADSVEWVAHTQDVRATLATLSGSVAGAEVELRDYLLTADVAHRNAYLLMVHGVPAILAELTSLTRDNTLQIHNLETLRRAVDARLAEMQGAYVAYSTFGVAAARAVIDVGRKARAPAQVRALVAMMDAEEVRLLAARETKTAAVRHSTLISLLVTLATATVTFLALFRGIRREMLARRVAVTALGASDRYNRSIVDSSPDCLGVLDLEGRLLQLTPQGCRLLEVEDFSSLAGIDWVSIWKEADREAVRDALDAARRGGNGRFQGFCPTQKGTPKWWDVIVMPIVGTGGAPDRLLSVARDISDVKRAEEESQEANRFLDSLIENLPVSVTVKDAVTRRIVRQNREAESLTGISRTVMLGRTPEEFLSAAEAEKGATCDAEALAEGILHESPEYTFEHRQFGPRTIRTMRVPIPDRHGRAQFLLTIGVDVTQERLTENAMRELNAALERKASELELTNKELESFSYSVSHDLRAPLRAIDGFALMLEEDFKEKLDAEGRRYLSVIRENSRRMGALIDDLLSFSRLGRLPVASHEVNVESLVREVVQEALTGLNPAGLAAVFPPQIDVGSLPSVRGDRGLLRQVWTNLISNAIKYSSKTPQPVIEVRGHANGTETLYSVRDNGVGFSMEYVEKLFGVFQRLHRADEFSGTGVGLAIVHRVVTRHGGRVWAEGRAGEGAVFSFALPKGAVNG